MKRLSICIVIVLSTSFAQAITVDQVNQVGSTSQLLVTDSQNIQSFSSQVQTLLANNWQIQVAPGYSIAVSSASVLATYQQLKNQLVTDYGTLP
jgi:hypothetical protein